MQYYKKETNISKKGLGTTKSTFFLIQAAATIQGTYFCKYILINEKFQMYENNDFNLNHLKKLQNILEYKSRLLFKLWIIVN